MAKTYGNPRAPLARHLIRWKFFDPGATWPEWIKSLELKIEEVRQLQAAGAVLDTSSGGDDYWWYTVPGHRVAMTDAEARAAARGELEDFDDSCPCGRAS